MGERNNHGRVHYVVVAACAAVLAGRSSPVRAADIDVLAGNIYANATSAVPTDAAVAADLSAVQSDGSFSGINYADTSTSNWQLEKHLNKLNELAIAYATPSSAYYHNAATLSAATSAYSYWLGKDYQSSNWFYNQIATPQKLGAAMIVMQQAGVLPTANFSKAISIVDRALKGQGGSSTGANLADQATATVYEGVLRYRAPGASSTEKSAATTLIQNSYNYIGSTLATATDLADDGIRFDHSYQSHQQTLYDGGYGLTLLTDTSKAAGWAAGTSYGMSGGSVHSMIDYVLDGGPQWMVRGTTFDPLALGRGWTRTGVVDSAAALVAPVNAAIALAGGYRTGELTTLKNRLADSEANGKATGNYGLTGNRAYWISDYMVQQRPGYMMSVNGVSSRTNTPESINGENLKGGYGTAGVNMVLRTGHEYDNIYPVWDWYRLPGTTSERSATGTGGSYSLLPDHHYGTTGIDGGASNGTVGAHVYTMSEYGITALKSNFFFDRGEVAMGNSIKQTTANTAGGLVGTNVNQTLLNGNVVYSTAAGQSTTIGSGQTVTPANLRWVNHDSVGYFFLTPVSNATISTVQQTGNWDSINTAGTLSTIRANVFSLDLNHGSLPTGGSYLYAVIPNLAANQMDSYLASNPFTVLRNDSKAQAVTGNASDITEINFQNGGAVTFANGITLTETNKYHPASMIWSPTGDTPGSTVKVSWSNVDGYATGLYTFTVTQHLIGTGAVYDSATHMTTLTFSPPTGLSAGSTLTQTFTVGAPEPAAVGVMVATLGLLVRRKRTDA